MGRESGHPDFTSDGYLVVRDLLPRNHLSDIQEAIHLLAGTDDLPSLREANPGHYGRVYDSLSVSAVVAQTITSPVLAMAGELLSAWPEELGVTGQMVRMDPPRDTRNNLDWHQEYRYYEQTWPENSLVVWFPVNDHDGLGGIEVAKGSHKYGLFDAEYTRTFSDQYAVDSDVVTKFETEVVDARPGDVVFFHMLLLHRTAENEGDQVKLSGGYRLHKMSGRDWRHGRLVYKYAVGQ